MTETMIKEHLNDIKLGFYDAMAWLTWEDPDYAKDIMNIPEDANFSIDDSVYEYIDYIITKFLKCVPEDLVDFYLEKYNDARLFGHDLYLTIERHGVGFWDRGLGESGDKLTEYALQMSESYPYYEDGKIYI